MAYFLVFRVTRHKMLWLILITGAVLDQLSAPGSSPGKLILGYGGMINSGLVKLGLDRQTAGISALQSVCGDHHAYPYAWVAFAILPIYVSLEKIDRSLLEAATDLGYRPMERFWAVTLPLSMPGVIATALLVFIPTVGDYVTPTLVGGSGGMMIGNSIQTLFGRANDAPLGSTLSIVMMLIVTLIVTFFLWAVGYRRMKNRRSDSMAMNGHKRIDLPAGLRPGLPGLSLWAGAAAADVLAERQHVCGPLPLGITLKAYRQMIRDPSLLSALRNSVMVRTVVSVVSTAFGLLAAMGATRYRLPARAGHGHDHAPPGGPQHHSGGLAADHPAPDARRAVDVVDGRRRACPALRAILDDGADVQARGFDKAWGGRQRSRRERLDDLLAGDLPLALPGSFPAC